MLRRANSLLRAGNYPEAATAFSEFEKSFPNSPLLPQALALSIPAALLIALLIGFGRLSADREFVVMKIDGRTLGQHGADIRAGDGDDKAAMALVDNGGKAFERRLRFAVKGALAAAVGHHIILIGARPLDARPLEGRKRHGQRLGH